MIPEMRGSARPIASFWEDDMADDHFDHNEVMKVALTIVAVVLVLGLGGLLLQLM